VAASIHEPKMNRVRALPAMTAGGSRRVMLATRVLAV
jgi:hypothetical protein